MDLVMLGALTVVVVDELLLRAHLVGRHQGFPTIKPPQMILHAGWEQNQRKDDSIVDLGELPILADQT